MSLVLSAPKIVLLAVHLAAKADLDSLSFIAANHGSVLRKELLLRILLTYLPETLKSEEYVSFVKEVDRGEYVAQEHWDVDISAVEHLSEEEAIRKVRKLHLLKLSWPGAPAEAEDDPLTLFLLRRSYKVDEEAGLLTQLPDLLAPFLEHSPCIRTWTISVLLPLLRRNHEFYPQNSIPITLSQFEKLGDAAAVDLLLSQTGVQEDYANVARDLRCLLGPWLYNDKRWTTTKRPPVGKEEDVDEDVDEDELVCPGWEQMLVWLTSQASTSWKVAVEAIDHWHGPEDVDLGGLGQMWMEEEKQQYLERRYAQAALACAYLVPDATTEALTGAYTITLEVTKLLDDPLPSLQTASSSLSPVPDLGSTNIMFAKHVTYLRNNMLEEDNILTKPSKLATTLLSALIVSAYLSTKAGYPMTARKAGELAILQDEREQRTEFLKLVHTITERGPNSDDKYWIKARNEILWLGDWGAEEEEEAWADADQHHCTVFGRLEKEFLEIEILKALLTRTRYSLAKSLYEDSPEQPLSKESLRDTIYAAAMAAYDNASNPNRTRGGLKKCNDIIYGFPGTIERSVVATQRIEALLKATHGLSDYKLVLKKGEPFTPVILRVHHDPLSIIEKVLQQNPKSYTQIQDLVDVGRNMVAAGLTVKDKSGHSALTAEMEPAQMLNAEKRITAMCIDAALTEDDFETAYTYVVNRLAALSGPPQAVARKASNGSLRDSAPIRDDWSWRAALQAGMYQRTARTVRPTHLGTASGNPEIRHLDQRIECLATALRIAPAATLPEILKSYRRTEEALDAAIKAEAEQENAWDEAADMQTMPGGGRQGTSNRHNAEEAPMSLFDLSRASMLSAQRNLTALSNFNLTTQSRPSDTGSDSGLGAGDQQQRARKRDQLREAAVGGLTAGVGWLIGAQPSARHREED
ncbi:secretory pathway Sec39 [Cryphonectria parasitica EP155]|uniref:Secretory pathway Sec39 n=1 Tax=Cryphonectria parasitica (strain ATCC 38755 / EP155) TaxID=660469 RepID=A0A9P5CVH1_CRYP1|nr:secretory pathway Sec39 [Cryphonectria parasitica EP155]KAF3770690.1 secretory pathway Sec39 [Cryphonectria parasitica EP155]